MVVFIGVLHFGCVCLSSDLYSLFTFEPLHNLFSSFLNVFKYFMTHYISSSTIPSKCTGRAISPPLFRFVKTSVHIGFKTALCDFQEFYVMSRMTVVFLQPEGSSELNGIFLQTGLRCILESKENTALQLFFPFVYAYAVKVTGFLEDAPLAKIHVQYTDISNLLTSFVGYVHRVSIDSRSMIGGGNG